MFCGLKCVMWSQIDSPLPSTSQAPSVWYELVPTPNLNPLGNSEAHVVEVLRSRQTFTHRRWLVGKTAQTFNEPIDDETSSHSNHRQNQLHWHSSYWKCKVSSTDCRGIDSVYSYLSITATMLSQFDKCNEIENWFIIELALRSIFRLILIFRYKFSTETTKIANYLLIQHFEHSIFVDKNFLFHR